MFEKSIFCVVATLSSLFFSRSSSFLQVTSITTISQMISNFDQIRHLTAELSALEFLKKSIFCVVATLASFFFSGSSSFLQVTRITTISWMSSNFGQISDCRVSCPLVFEKVNILCCGHSSIFVFQWIFFILAGNKDNYNISDGL